MNCSKIAALALLGVVSALVLVQAGHYGGGSSAGHAHSLAHYGGGACHGYGCNNEAPRPASSHGPYGPYHSYAVRPVIYGGRGMYHYKGYARHTPAPAAGHQRYARSYGSGSRGHAARHYAAPARHYAAPARHYAPAPAHHMRPIQAILLVADHHAQPSYDHHRGPRSAGHYSHQPQRSSYGSGHASAHGASQYGAANTHAHQMRQHHGGYRQQNAGGHYGGNGHY